MNINQRRIQSVPRIDARNLFYLYIFYVIAFIQYMFVQVSVYTEKVFFQTSIDTDAYAPQPISPKTGSLAASFMNSGVGSRNYCNLH